MKDPLAVSPSKGNQGITRGNEKILLTSVGIEPTTSGFDLPLLCRLSYEVGQRQSGTILGGESRRRESKGLSWVSHSTLIYTAELILCSTICVHSATRHNIHMYPYFLFAAIHHLKSSPTVSVRPRSSVGRVTVDLIRRSWVRFPPRSKEFFLYLVWFPDSL